MNYEEYNVKNIIKQDIVDNELFKVGNLSNYKAYSSYLLHLIYTNLDDNFFDGSYCCFNNILRLKNVNKSIFYTNLLKYYVDEDLEDRMVVPFFRISDEDYVLGMCVYDNDDLYLKQHESNHLMSYKNGNTKKIPGKDFTIKYYNIGFSKNKLTCYKNRYYDDVTYGEGLNEGFTDYLASLMVQGNDSYYINIDKPEAVGYLFLFQYVKALVDIIGKDLMIKLYCNADLNGLINELSKYTSKKEVKAFINTLDDVLMIDNSNISYENYNSIFNKCNSFLINLSKNKYNKIVCENNLVKNVIQLDEDFYVPSQYLDELYKKYNNDEIKRFASPHK